MIQFFYYLCLVNTQKKIFSYAKKRKIFVCGTEINTHPTPELSWALILGLARNLKEEIDNMYQGYWQTTIGIELKGKILGLIGLGKVGTQVAKIAKAFGMQVVAWSENLNLDTCKELDVLPCSKEDLIKNSDIISIHVQGGERYNCLLYTSPRPRESTRSRMPYTA